MRLSKLTLSLSRGAHVTQRAFFEETMQKDNEKNFRISLNYLTSVAVNRLIAALHFLSVDNEIPAARFTAREALWALEKLEGLEGEMKK